MEFKGVSYRGPVADEICDSCTGRRPRREYEIVVCSIVQRTFNDWGLQRSFGAHKNIVTFIAAVIKPHTPAVKEYMLLTDYYPSK